MSATIEIHSAVLKIYSGEQPQSVSDPVTGALVAVAEFPDGLTLDQPVAAQIVSAGTARYGRLYVNGQAVRDWSMTDMGLPDPQPVDWGNPLTFTPR